MLEYCITRAWIEPPACERCGGDGFLCLRCYLCGRPPGHNEYCPDTLCPEYSPDYDGPAHRCGFYRVWVPIGLLAICEPCWQRERAN